ncbi:MAG: hypothetical protein JSU87_03715 [Gemmatimonadota bacterium]|nr:MAG: hypothetical protein JSU87_03715 [Gemmatimonadota bacterium]
MNRLLFGLAATLAVFAIAPAAGASAQEPATDTVAQALSVFLDCNAHNCDFDHFRREIVWVNWVRDRRDADIHLLVTAEETGGGGWRYTLDYIGRRGLEDLTKSNLYISDPDDTDAEVREALTRFMALGLVQFVEGTPLAPRLRIMYEAPAVAVVQREELDPWNLWVFRLELDVELEGEKRESSNAFGASVHADRVAEDLKINIGLAGEYMRDEFEFDDGELVSSTSEEYFAGLSAVWSLDDHWSAGGGVNADRSTFLNRDLALFVGPALEYNIFPYSESTRRQVTFRYMLEVGYFNYELETIEGQTEETLPRHSLIVGAAVQQPWGEIHGSLEGIQYLHDLKAHRINSFVEFEYRLFRGLNFDIELDFSRIKDQFFLPKEGLSEEEILLRRRQRETDYRYELSVGLSYRFGSKFANIVNPRME